MSFWKTFSDDQIVEEKKKRIKIFPALFSNRNFMFLWFSQILTQVGLGTFTISMAILSDKGILHNSLQQSATGIGVIVFISNLPALFFSALAGIVADWVDRKKIMMIVNLSRFLIMLIFVVIGGWNNYVTAYLALLLMSTVSQFFIPAEGSAIPSIVDKSSILLANSLFSVTLYSTFIFGVAGSGQSIEKFGLYGNFILICVLFMFGFLSMFLVKIPATNGNGRPKIGSVFAFFKEILNSLKQAVAYIKQNKITKYTLIHIFIIQVAVLTFVTMIFRIGREVFGLESQDIGPVLLLPAGIGAALGFLLMNTIGRARDRIKIINEGVFSVGFGLIIMTTVAVLKRFSQVEIPYSFAMSTFSVFLIALGAPLVVIPAQALMHEKTQDEFRGRVYGLWLAINQTFAALPAILLGYMVDKFLDVYGFMMVATVLVFFYAGLLYFIRPKIDY